MKRPGHILATVVLAAGAAIGCGEARPVTYGVQQCTSYREDIQPLLEKQCADCHSGATPAGGYDVTTYLTTITDSTGKVVAAAGDASSVLLQTVDPSRADATHGGFGEVYTQLSAWVVGCDLSYFKSEMHPGGILDSTNPDFHGKLVKDLGYQFSVCQKCHGEDFSGGKAKVSCLTCHKDPGGPTACTTCHGQPPSTGGHVAHVKGSALARPFDCTECHVKPMVYTDVGHLFNADGSVINAPAAVTFGPLAKTSGGGVTRKGDPAWSHDAATCENVYCHGGAFNDSNAKVNAPLWTGGESQGQCGACHGLPPSDHGAGDKCATCHPGVAVSSSEIKDKSRHLDGKISLGDESGECWACHGTPGNPAPPRDLNGNTDPSLITIGAHAAHLGASHRIRGPVPCVDCHDDFKKPTDPGHIDHPAPASVFPAAASSRSLAWNDGATPSWDHAAGTCANVYCHGGGTKNAKDTASTLSRTPLWTGGTPQIYCGSCHGIPPEDGVHIGYKGLNQCALCHPQTIDATGQLIVTGPPGQETSTHINGVVDVQH